MDFRFDDAQRAFQQVLREFLAQACTPDDVRALWDDNSGLSRDRWKRLADLGALGLTVPGAYGGLGLDDVAYLLPLEEAGRAALPEPLGETVGVAVPLLRDAAAGDEWLARVAVGEAVAAVGLGEAPLVDGAHVADVLLLGHEDELHAVGADGVRLERRASLDPGRRSFRVEWTPAAATCIGQGKATRAALAAAADRRLVCSAAELLGVAAKLIEMATDHARERHQFGRPIGAFQAVKHLLADTLVRLAFARPVVYRAAASLADDAPTRARDAAMAKVFAAEAALDAARAALQIHGAIGYTWEHDLSIWIKRAHTLALTGGDARHHRRRVADALLPAA